MTFLIVIIRTRSDEWNHLVRTVGKNLHHQLRIRSFIDLAILWQFNRFHAPISRLNNNSIKHLFSHSLIFERFPATKWGQGEWEPDLYDCRLRPWYLQAASSAKDMIILVDTSGSMTGVRKEIAKHVVLTLLDTLSENDFINIYKFSDNPIPVVPCFKDKLVHVS